MLWSRHLRRCGKGGFAISQPEQTAPKFGTFTGVFTPTLLTILGVIMYVRMGWVVGNAGVAGALLIMGLSLVITACTGLSLSSIATNTRIGAGGPYAIMNRSLGLEIGGAIGIPLYLTRPLGVAMYVFGFREGVQWVFPELPSLPIDLGVFAFLFAIAYKSADLAFKAQYVIMGVIALSLISIFTSPTAIGATSSVPWWGEFPGSPEKNFQGTDFWGVFAVFFPATTGILAGANMSGDLKDPRRAIPIGTLAAIAVSAVVYFFVAIWVSRLGTPEELTSNYNLLIDLSWSPTLVLAGLLGATASSALAGLVGGPRILMAMGQNRIVPYSTAMAKTQDGEPRNAMLVTGVLTVCCIMVRDLNAIAPLVTMFFLITYCMINVVVLFEDGLGLVSYRPTLRVPRWIPFTGLVGCVFSMFIVNPTFGLIAVSVVIAVYLILHMQGVDDTHKSDARSTMFVAFAQWAASKVSASDLSNIRAWKPNLLVPVKDAEEFRGSFPVVVDLTAPEGSVMLLGLSDQENAPNLRERLVAVGNSIRNQGIMASWSILTVPGYVHAIEVGMMALQGAFFRPNLLFLRLGDAQRDVSEVQGLVRTAKETGVGVILYHPHERAGLGQRQRVRMYVRPAQNSWKVDDAFEQGNLDLILLMGYRISRHWGGELSLATVVENAEDVPAAQQFQRHLCDIARLPPSVVCRVEVGSMEEASKHLGVCDLAIFGLAEGGPDVGWARQMSELSSGACLFVRDSGGESARI